MDIYRIDLDVPVSGNWDCVSRAMLTEMAVFRFFHQSEVMQISRNIELEIKEFYSQIFEIQRIKRRGV